MKVLEQFQKASKEAWAAYNSAQNMNRMRSGNMMTARAAKAKQNWEKAHQELLKFDPDHDHKTTTFGDVIA